MDKGKIIGGVLAAAAIGVGIYYGFVKKAEDGLTWFARITKKPEDETKASEIQTPTNNTGIIKPAGKATPKPKPAPKADPVPTATFKKGDSVMAGQDMALFTQPSAEARFTKANAARFDIIGAFDSTASAYPGWAKIYVTKTLKYKGANVPNKWMAYVKTNMLTNPVK